MLVTRKPTQVDYRYINHVIQMIILIQHESVPFLNITYRGMPFISYIAL